MQATRLLYVERMVAGEDVEVRHLRALVALVDEGTFTDAAIALGTTQASVTRTIQQLERLLGRRLVDRTNRGATPTPAGRDLADRAVALLADWDALVADAPPQRLTVGCPWAGFGGRTDAIYAGWEARATGVELAIAHVDSPAAGVLGGRADLALLRSPAPAGLSEAVVGTERRLAAVARTHALGRRRRVTLAELAAHPIGINRRTGTTDESLFGTPVSVVDTLDTDHWLDLIVRGVCVGITSEATADHYARPGVRFLPVTDAPPLSVRLAWRRSGAHPLVETLVDVAREVYAST